MADVLLNARADINSHIEMAANAGAGVINPETFYTKQLLDTIRYDASEYVYFRLADESPIPDKSDKLQLRRWAPLQAHTVPLEEGVPPKSDKGSVEKYEINAAQYGRYMEFTDKVDFQVVDPVVAHYTREYSLVAMETLDLLARDALLAIANQHYAGGAANFEALTLASTPSMADLRLIVLSLKKALVKPRMNGKYHVIASPEFFYDMISDTIVEKYMSYNQTTKNMYDTMSALVPMFDMEYYETMLVPTSSEYEDSGVTHKRMYRLTGPATYEFDKVGEDEPTYVTSDVDGWVKDSRTGQDASYIPGQIIWDTSAWSTANLDGGNEWYEFKAQHVLILGKDALTRTGLSNEGQAKMYVKQKGSAGVLDPIDQRQSIGFKINSVGFGSTRLEAVVDYICVPTQVNPV
jgi:hypothetical protein